MIEFSNHQRAGFLPEFLSEHDPRPAKEQIDTAYAHGGGWRTFRGFTLSGKGLGATIAYPGDPAMRAVAVGQLRSETIILFEYDWVAIVQDDGTYEIARID